MRAVATAMAVALLFVAQAHPAPVDRLRLAVGSLDGQCTMQAIRPNLIITASHCVGVPGGEYQAIFVRGVAEVVIPATLVWDGAFSDYEDPPDIAILSIVRSWPHTVPLAENLPNPGDKMFSLTFALGIRHWPIVSEYESLRFVERHGWSVVFRGEVGGGASGAALTKDGKLIGTISAGADVLKINIGVPVGLIGRALRDLDKRGPMFTRPGWAR